MNRRNIISLGVLESDKQGRNLVWKSKDKSLSWNFASYMPILIRDALKTLAIDPTGCPSILVDEFNGDADMACVEWSKRLNQLADKFDYASKIFESSQFLSEEDQTLLDNYYSNIVKPTKNEEGDFVIEHNSTPDYVKKIYEKEKNIVDDMEKTLKEALAELSEIWYGLWD